MKSLLLDSDIFVMALRYQRDLRYPVNKQFLEKINSRRMKAVTSIFNVLEVCGILSFNLTEQELLDLYEGFADRFHVRILFPADQNGNLDYDLPRVFRMIQRKQSLGDAQVGYVAERFQEHISAFVSWNARHFEGKIPIPATTPDQL